MHRFVTWVQGFALSLGGPGIFLIALLDSSFVPFPEVVDLLIILFVTRHPERMIYYSGLATLGSMLGCSMLYMVGRKGGEAFLRRRFKGRHVDRTLSVFQKYGLLAVAVPALLPPPFPFKPFVLVAGVARVRPLDFLIAIGIGRGIRYFGEGLLAVWYGEQAALFVRNNAREVSLAFASVVLVAGIAWIWYRRRRPSTQIDESPPKPL